MEIYLIENSLIDKKIVLINDYKNQAENLKFFSFLKSIKKVIHTMKAIVTFFAFFAVTLSNRKLISNFLSYVKFTSNEFPQQLKTRII